MDISYIVHPPNPSDPRARSRKLGSVDATCDKLLVGRLSFGLGPGEQVIRTTEFETAPNWRRKGIATGLFTALATSYPEFHIVESGMDRTPDGDALVVSIRARGLPFHEPQCFSLETGERPACRCPIGE